MGTWVSGEATGNSIFACIICCIRYMRLAAGLDEKGLARPFGEAQDDLRTLAGRSLSSPRPAPFSPRLSDVGRRYVAYGEHKTRFAKPCLVSILRPAT